MAACLSLLICGDICPTDDTRALFDAGSPEALFGTLAARLAAADLALANLECVLSDRARPIAKIGPALRGSASDAAILARAGLDLVGIANNHIGDCGPEGVLDTIAACAAAGIGTTGAGCDAAAAAQPAILEKAGWRIGVMAVAEHEFNAAAPGRAGAHIFDPLEDLERLKLLAGECDYVVVLYHGGIEYHPLPSPALQRRCRALVRNGADLVLCQHSHVIGSFESYGEGHILYGQGNTVFGHRAGKPSWNEGLAVGVSLSRAAGVEARIDLVPIRCGPTGGIGLMPPEAAGACLAEVAGRSEQTQDPARVQAEWETFCRRAADAALAHMLGLNIWLTRANRLLAGRLVRALYSRRQRMTTMNFIRCDAHREVVLTALDETLGAPAKGGHRR